MNYLTEQFEWWKDEESYLDVDRYHNRVILMSNRKGTYFEIDELRKRVDELENKLNVFMEKWGPDVQEKRDKRDKVWDEMIRVLTVQERNNKGK